MPKTRITLELDEAAVKAVEAVKARVGAKATVDVIRRALSLFDLITEHAQKGGKVVFKHADGKSETIKLL